MATAEPKTGLQIPELKALKEKNPTCCDCDNKYPDWASVNLGIFLCAQCAGVHRSLGTHISKVRSLSLDTWNESWVNNMKLSPDFNQNWEYYVPKKYPKPRANSSRALREKYITCKYVGESNNNNNNNNDNNDDGEVMNNGLRPLFHIDQNKNQPQRCDPIYDDTVDGNNSQNTTTTTTTTATNSTNNTNNEVEEKKKKAMKQTDGVLVLRVIGCSDLPKADTLSDSDPYVVFDSQFQQVKTKTIDNNNDPQWNETLMLTVTEDAAVKIRVYDADDVGADDLIGYASLSVCHDCKPHQEVEFKLKLIVPSKYVKQKKSPILHFYVTYNKMA